MASMARVRNVPTWRMTAEELARVWADHHEITGRTGGWLYTRDGRPVCHGYSTLAAHLTRQQITVVGLGVDWMRSHRLGGVQVTRGLRSRG